MLRHIGVFRQEALLNVGCLMSFGALTWLGRIATSGSLYYIGLLLLNGSLLWHVRISCTARLLRWVAALGGSLFYIGLLRLNGSLRTDGSLLPFGSLTTFGFLARFGSLCCVGLLDFFGSLVCHVFITSRGSLVFHGLLNLRLAVVHGLLTWRLAMLQRLGLSSGSLALLGRQQEQRLAQCIRKTGSSRLARSRVCEVFPRLADTARAAPPLRPAVRPRVTSIAARSGCAGVLSRSARFGSRVPFFPRLAVMLRSLFTYGSL